MTRETLLEGLGKERYKCARLHWLLTTAKIEHHFPTICRDQFKATTSEQFYLESLRKIRRPAPSPPTAATSRPSTALLQRRQQFLALETTMKTTLMTTTTKDEMAKREERKLSLTNCQILEYFKSAQKICEALQMMTEKKKAS